MVESNGLKSINFASLFGEQDIICQTSLTEHSDVIMALLKELAYDRGIGNVDKVYEAVMARESEVSTVLSPGIAMPHARLDTITDLVVGVATSREGIAFPDQSKGLVHLMILILAPKDKPGAYL